MIQPRIALALLAVPFSQGIAAAEIGNSQRGLDYARTACAECHAVLALDYNWPMRYAPPFQKIAKTKGVTRLALTAFLQTSHAEMPNLMVEGEDADDLIAYILSLKGVPDQP